MAFATLLCSLRKGVVTTLLSVYGIKFRLKRDRQRVMFRVTVCALEVPVTQRNAMQEFFLVVFVGSLVVCATMVENVTRVSCCRFDELSFLVLEKGDDRGGAWPWHARMTAPKFELLVCSVHIANFASQTFVVTYQ